MSTPRTSIATKSTTEDLTAVLIQFTDGETLNAQLADMSEDIQRRLALHGLSQKLGDSYSGEKDVAVARAKAEGVLKNLIEGDWKKASVGGGGGISDLVRALSELTGQSIEACTEVVSNLEKKDKAELRKDARIAEILARYSAERAAAKAEAAKTSTSSFNLEALMGGNAG